MWASAGGNLHTSECSGLRNRALVQDFLSVLYTVNINRLVRQMLCSLLVAQLLRLALLLWKAVFLCPVSLTSISFSFCFTNADVPKMPIMVSAHLLTLTRFSVLCISYSMWCQLLALLELLS